MSKVLITGISGLIGKHLAELLLGQSTYKIKGQYFSARNKDLFVGKPVEMVQADICVPEQLQGICEGCQVVVHSAARVIDHGTKRDFYLAHVDATRFMLEEAAKSKVEHFIYISSFGPATYIDRTNGIPDEKVSLKMSGVHYDDAKIVAENLVKTFCSKHQIAYTIIRPGAVIGPDSVWVREPLVRMHKAPGVALINKGETDACLIDARNLAEGIFKVMTQEVARGQTYFFVDNYGVNWKTFINDVLGIVGKKTTLSFPKAIILPIAQFLNFIMVPMGKKPPFSPKAIMALGSDRRVSTEKAKRELGWNTHYTYLESLENITKWVEENKERLGY